MATQVRLGDVSVDVVLKDIKHVHLSVHPPTGRVRIAAPSRMSLDTIRVFAVSKIGWIKQQQKKLREQERETPREFLDRESHYVWGKRYLLSIREGEQSPSVELKHSRMILCVRSATDGGKKQEVIEAWYRNELKQTAPALITKWQLRLDVDVERFFVQRMKTKWGSCNPAARSIRLNTELAKKPRECLEYIVVHEMVHLIERTHNARFVALMERYLPNWKVCRQMLNQLPVRHETWRY
jgi:predicted metal-dependent hydrolase